jgi:hypothetical protein
MTSQTANTETQSDEHRRATGFLHRWVLPRLTTPNPVNPALRQHAQERAKDGQNRLADTICRPSS